VKVLHLFLSPAHIYVGHFGGPSGTTPAVEVDEMNCVAGSGIIGDRYCNHKPDYIGQITFFEIETHRRLCEAFGIFDKSPATYRRNVIVEGQDLNELIGKEFEIQGVRFLGTEESKPCLWMNEAFAEGALNALVGKGGLRAKILCDGTLRRDRNRNRNL
jgi:MOSC domain-containing protein YiiM